MSKILFLLLVGLCSCSDAVEAPIFVTNVVMPVAVADPGSEVTIQGKGFEADDDLFVRLGLSTVRAEVVGVEIASIRFVVPGGLPAGMADILLMRQGEFMLLGTMPFSDGQPPLSASLYGVGRNKTGAPVMSRIDPSYSVRATPRGGDALLKRSYSQ